MRCKEAHKQVQLYIDGRLSLKKTRALEAHIASCAACREELLLLEEGASSLSDSKLVAEPGDLHQQIMRRVAMAASSRDTPQFSLLRPSLLEWLAAIILATVATLGLILQQPSLRAVLPVANGHDSLSLAPCHFLHMLTTIDSNTLTFALWIIGTVLGICITLAFAGNEMRSQWFKAMLDRLPGR